MRAPMKWLKDFVDLGEMTGRELAEKLISLGLEVETVDEIGGEISGPLVIGKVLEFTEEPQKNGKTIRYCQVDVGEAHGGIRGIVCGAENFRPGDYVVVALPGCVLPGGFEIAARKTYGHVSDGMICAEDELGIGQDHSGIMVLGDCDDQGMPWELGADALAAIGVCDDVLDIAVTPDMGYCFSIRGIAREAAQALGLAFKDPLTTPNLWQEKTEGYPVVLAAESVLSFVALQVSGIDPTKLTPKWMVNRLNAAGMRSISLPVDISNYVMLETGQPNHIYDQDRLSGAIKVRWANPGEELVTLDEVTHKLSSADLVIADESGPIGLAGLMGGFSTEINSETRNVVIEAANFDSITVARMARRQKFSSEAAKRFERGVDPQAAYPAALLVAKLLVELAGGELREGQTVVGKLPGIPSCSFDISLVGRVLGIELAEQRIIEILQASGCQVVKTGSKLVVTAPSWRPDLREPYEFVEEIGRKIGFSAIEAKLVTPPTGRGFTREQRGKKAIMQALVAGGFVEILSFPFIAETDLDQLLIPETDIRRKTVRVANPLADTVPLMRTTLLPGLFQAVRCNASRSQDDVALMEYGSVFFRSDGVPAPEPAVTNRPSAAEWQALNSALPKQPKHLAVVVSGNWIPLGWQHPAIKAGWQQAFLAADLAAQALGAEIIRKPVNNAPWHPGRAAELWVADTLVGYAGELHPKVIKAYALAPRAAAMELDVDALLAVAPESGNIAAISTWPAVKEDIAFVVSEEIRVQELLEVIKAGGGELLESVTLFDIYRGEPLAEGQKSVGFSLRYRAADRTLKDAEVSELRAEIVAEAQRKFAAELRTY